MASKLKPENDTPPGAVDPRKPAVRVKAGSLHAAIKDVLGIVESRNTIPILSHVRLAGGNGRIEITASDLDIWAVRDLASDNQDGPASKDWIESIRPFAMTMPAKAMGDVLGEIDGEAMVTLTAPHGDETRAVVSAGRARFKLACLPVDEFPLPPLFSVQASFEVHCSQLADSFAAIEHAISTEETRYYLNGVYLHPVDLDLRMAATDGHRLARLTLDAPDGGASFPPVIVGRKTVGVLDKLLAAAAKTTDGKETEPASVLVEANGEGKGCLLRFAMPASDGGEIEITAKTIDGDYPDYQRVIPSAPAYRAVLDRAGLVEVVRRVAVMGAGKSKIVKAEFSKDRLTLSARSDDLGEGSEEIEADYLGPDQVLGFNSAFWRETLGAIASDRIAMAWDEPREGLAAVRVSAWVDSDEDPRLTQVLMTTRVA